MEGGFPVLSSEGLTFPVLSPLQLHLPSLQFIYARDPPFLRQFSLYSIHFQDYRWGGGGGGVFFFMRITNSVAFMRSGSSYDVRVRSR